MAMAAAAQAGTHTTHTRAIQAMATDKTMVEVHTAHMSGQHQNEAAAEATAAGAAAEATAAGAASGHKPESVSAMNEATVKTVTKNEVVDIIRVLGYQAIPKDDEEFGEIIFSSSDGICWNIYLGHSGPFFDEIIVTLFSASKVSPIESINGWNLNSFSVASPEIDSETNQVVKNQDGTYPVTFSTRINLEGGVTMNHIQSRLNEWVHEIARLTKLENFIFPTPIKVTDNWSS